MSSRFLALVEINLDLDQLIARLREAKDACKRAKEKQEAWEKLFGDNPPQEFLWGKNAIFMLPPGFMMYFEVLGYPSEVEWWDGGGYQRRRTGTPTGPGW